VNLGSRSPSPNVEPPLYHFNNVITALSTLSLIHSRGRLKTPWDESIGSYVWLSCGHLDSVSCWLQISSDRIKQLDNDTIIVSRPMYLDFMKQDIASSTVSVWDFNFGTNLKNAWTSYWSSI